MLEKFFRATSLAVLALLCTLSILFLGEDSSYALIKGWTPPEETLSRSENNSGNILESAIELPEENTNKESENLINGMSMQDIFGDEQIYPFEQGIGGHGGGDLD